MFGSLVAARGSVPAVPKTSGGAGPIISEGPHAIATQSAAVEGMAGVDGSEFSQAMRLPDAEGTAVARNSLGSPG